MLDPNRQPGFNRFLRPWRRTEPRPPARAARAGDDDNPLRAELLSVDQLRRHFRELAGWHRVVERRWRSDPLLDRLDDNAGVLGEVTRDIAAAAAEKRRLAPAAEWLLDNAYLIEEQIRTARRHFPRSYNRQLPKLVNGPLTGYARAYVLAYQLIIHVDGRVDAGSLAAAIGAYQEAQPLKLGELWAIPIMLRLALIENLRRVALRVASGREHGAAAESWADRLLDLAERKPTELIGGLADLSRSMETLSAPFVADFSRRIQGRHPGMTLVLSWVEQRLGEHGATIEQLVQAETQAQAADQVSVGHAIGSLRFLGALDWREFVESQSAVEQALRDDPADVYNDMDFATRDRYRHEVERVARRSPLSEPEVAQLAVALARKARGDGDDARRRHIGWWLIGEGLRDLERAASMRRPATLRIARLSRRLALPLYLGGVGALCGGVMWLAGLWAAARGLHPAVVVAWMVLAGLCASSTALALVNWLCALLIVPRSLPRLDFTEGVPGNRRALVAVPCLLRTEGEIDELLEAMEVRYVANRDPEVAFALLSDFADAASAETPRDAALLERAVAGVEALNAKYGDEDTAFPFMLMHRPRTWCERERAWMGRERKRGKLADLDHALRGPCGSDGVPPGFSAFVGDHDWLLRVKYVVPLDADTQLPMDAVRKLVGAMAHPLNRPLHDPGTNLVTRGHGLLQPRVAISLPSAGRSRWARLSAIDPGIDPYTRAVSDVYQDLFDEGSYIGKGIYDVDAFETALGGRVPAGRVLSHDLLEGCFVRSGLLSDALLFEDTPARYLADAARRHRWIRGDWQIAGWLRWRAPAAKGRMTNPLSLLSQWKILDNLRRSLVPAALVAWVGWCFVLDARLWLLLPLAAFALPPALSLIRELLGKAREVELGHHLRRVASSAALQAAQAACQVAFVAHEAAYSLDATLRAWWRMLISRRRLLEWKTAAEAEREATTGLRGTCAAMSSSSLLAVGIAAVIAALAPVMLAPASPVLIAWFCAPGLAWWLSRPLPDRAARIDADDARWLRARARRTWRWFETFPSGEHHWLPPDNYQEHPVAVVAARTSPTNIGCAALCQLAAHDFGYVGGAELGERLDRLLGTVERLERYHGHLYNWYDTRTLRPLTPLYVSTVDSGNLCGHLLTLAAGLDELARTPLIAGAAVDGLRDTVACWREALSEEDPSLAQLERIDAALAQHHPTLAGTHLALDALRATGRELRETGDEDARWWAAAFEHACQRWQDEIAQLAPWVLVGQPSGEWDSPPEELGALRRELAALDAEPPSLERLSGLDRELAPRFEALAATAPSGTLATWLAAISRQLAEAAKRARARLATLAELAARCRALAAHDFTFLYDRARDLFAIGYNASDHRLDGSFYDLLASEARLASYIAVAQGQVKQEHWFTLGRLLTAPGVEPALLSWSGSMFEYLMPLLVMPDHQHTLLHRTYRAVIARQVEFGRERGVPWGVSESGYNATDAQLNYQYRAFGVPGLGLKRGLGEDLVIAPYATALALMVDPEEATRNLRRLREDGREGRYGFFEAVDYTAARLPPAQKAAVVRSWMAHHQGMAFLALAYTLLGRPMQRRFLADPLFRAADLLLHEKVPKAQGPIFPHADDVEPRRGGAAAEPAMRVYTSPATTLPEVHLLSNGRYHVMVTPAGGGSSRWRDLAVTRWREDWLRDAWGQFLYLRDRENGTWWSAAHQPAGRAARRYEAVFTQGRAEFKRRDRDIDSHLEIAVSPEDDIELRRVTLINSGDATRVIELTTYAEVVIAPANADLAHPAFSNLFVRTEIVRERQAILCTRRARSPGEKPPWMFHLVAVEGVEDGDASFDTSRFRFVGRGRTPTDPQAMAAERLSGAEGSVLDPIVAVRRTLRIAPDTSARFDVVTGMAETREQALAMIEKYRERRIAERVFELAWTHSQVVLRQLNADEAGAQLYGRLAGAVVFPTPVRRAERGLIAANRRGQPGLWGYGISGDLPIALLRVSDPEKLAIVAELARAHAYWRMKGLACDLVILVEDRSVYRGPLHEQVQALVSAVPGVALDRPGGIFVRRIEQIPAEDRVLIQAAARIVLSDGAGTLVEQLARRPRPEQYPPHLALRAAAPLEETGPDLPPRRDLVFDNGLGGFTRDGKEYVMTLGPGQATPAPWANVIANAGFGTVVDEGGAAYTWAENCHEFRLTAWHNDPVGGSGGEALWLRDDERGEVWSPSPYPARDQRPYIVRHGFGYSVFEHARGGILSEVWTYVAVDAPVKITLVKLRNRSGRRRRLSVASYSELVLGELRQRHAPHVVTALDPRTGALVATNAWNAEFAGRAAFLDVSEIERTVTGDRLEFLGRNGSYQRPQALGRQRLSNQVGAGLDPCFAAMAPIELGDGQEREIAFVLGAGKDLGEAQALAQRFHGVGAARAALDGVWQFWNRAIGVLRVETPEPQLDLVANGWLVYQTLACRFWARSGFYQSGGAYGFRDQLQDSLALLHAAPQQTREHLLRAAAHQFAEGDVLHWWHPPQDRGVRTHFSDDYLWLPYAVCKYVEATADTGVLDEQVPFLEGRPLLPEEEARYDLWARSGQVATLWEHCLRATRHGLRFGAHGLPLMGCGDWNDGMNLVGIHGRGESVWLGFFLCDVLARMSARARLRGEAAAAEEFATARTQLAERIGEQAWDGEWYRRAWFDDGTPLGSHENPECQIDALPQSWAVLSGVADPDRARRGMTAAYFRLVDQRNALVKLFDPPFDKSALEPGYIKGYVPGVRENGGQYTHAAVWTAMAFAELGDRERAWELTRMITPVHHGGDAAAIARYQVEPYVVSADVYAVAPHAGRGGWSWYTGSAGWLYRLITESLLGLTLRDARLAFAPRTPDSWNGFKAEYRFHDTLYRIEFARVAGLERLRVMLDGAEQPGDDIGLENDRREHQVRVEHG